MVFKELSNLDLWLWVYRENVRNYPGIHCTATPAACATLVTAFEAMQRTGSGTRLIPARPIAPSEEAKITGGQRHRSLASLRVTLTPPSSSPARLFSATLDEGRVMVELSSDAMGEFIDGFREVAQGNGDFCLTHGRAKTPRTNPDQLDGRPLPFWFWPCFGHLAPDR